MVAHRQQDRQPYLRSRLRLRKAMLGSVLA